MADPSARRRPNLVLIVVLGVVALAVIAVIASVVGGDDDDTTASAKGETRDVEVSGAALPTLEDPANDAAVGQPAPVVTGEMFSGQPLSVPREGRPAVVVFLAHWCPHCQREAPFLVEHFEENGMPEGIDVLAVSTGVDPSAPNYPPSEWLARERWDIATLVDDEDGGAARAFGLSAYPYFVAIDGDGNVVARTSGELQAAQVEALFEAARGG